MKHKTIILTIIILIIITSILLISNNNKTTSNLQEITYNELLTKQKNKDNFILIVSRSNCSHCNSYKPKVDEIAKKNNLIVYYINTDTLNNKDEFKDEFNLNNSTPLTLFFKSGKETSILNRIEGDLSIKTIKEQFKKMGFID